MVSTTVFRSVTVGLLFDPLTSAGDEDFMLARLIFLARRWRMTKGFIGVTTRLVLAALLLTFDDVFAVSGPVARFATVVSST